MGGVPIQRGHVFHTLSVYRTCMVTFWRWPGDQSKDVKSTWVVPYTSEPAVFSFRAYALCSCARTGDGSVIPHQTRPRFRAYRWQTRSHHELTIGTKVKVCWTDDRPKRPKLRYQQTVPTRTKLTSEGWTEKEVGSNREEDRWRSDTCIVISVLRAGWCAQHTNVRILACVHHRFFLPWASTHGCHRRAVLHSTLRSASNCPCGNEHSEQILSVNVHMWHTGTLTSRHACLK